jgi:hypothetical protein
MLTISERVDPKTLGAEELEQRHARPETQRLRRTLRKISSAAVLAFSTSYTAFSSGQMTVIGIREEVERELQTPWEPCDIQLIASHELTESGTPPPPGSAVTHVTPNADERVSDTGEAERPSGPRRNPEAR